MFEAAVTLPSQNTITATNHDTDLGGLSSQCDSASLRAKRERVGIATRCRATANI